MTTPSSQCPRATGPAKIAPMPLDTDLPPDGADERPIRVSIVDDDPFALRMLRSYLDSSPRIEVLSTFTSASDVLPFLRRMRHDVLITDMRMPGMNGLELLTRVKKESPDVAVIVLTSFDDDSTMLNALAQHASGFLLKDASPDEVVRAVIAAHRGGTTISPVSASRLISQHLRPPRSGAGSDLTETEEKVLNLLCDGLSNADIAASLTVSESTVKVHVSHLLKKYGASSRLELVVMVYKQGGPS